VADQAAAKTKMSHVSLGSFPNGAPQIPASLPAADLPVAGANVNATFSPGICDFTFEALRAALSDAGMPAGEARDLWRALYRRGAAAGPHTPPLSNRVRGWVARTFPGDPLFDPGGLIVTDEVTSSDRTTRKWVLGLAEGHRVETVLMSFRGRFTACLSTQAGCAMGCVFCATGQQGFGRHLTPGEMVGQILLANRRLERDGQTGIRNVVLMGMGEPLHNYESVMTALEILTDRRGLSIGPRRITISTVGVVPAIHRLVEERRPYNLAVSLHAASDHERAALVPVTKRWPLAQLMTACRAYTAQMRRRIFFEWTLIAGKNDSADSARQLAHLLGGIDAHVNLIPLNPTPAFLGAAPATPATVAFQAALRAHGIPSTVRQRRGIEMAAGCGQLAGGPV
jgi:23S rRNA (adenine2503-C2)-methyltransferase